MPGSLVRCQMDDYAYVPKITCLLQMIVPSRARVAFRGRLWVNQHKEGRAQVRVSLSTIPLNGGAVSARFKNNMLDSICTHHMDMLFIWEPRISGEKALSVVKSLGFPCFEIVDAVGFFVGLWLLWDNNKVNVEILGTFDQSITACVTLENHSPWIFTGVYAHPCTNRRAKLWDYLSFASVTLVASWRLQGDVEHG
ncbi:unnamed protein product [Prunus brigantina]